MGNNQMFMANVHTGDIQRFLVGPQECEITGITWSGDKRIVFAKIQQPRERQPNKCHFPDGGNSVPRSAVIAITRTDRGIIGRLVDDKCALQAKFSRTVIDHSIGGLYFWFDAKPEKGGNTYTKWTKNVPIEKIPMQNRHFS